MNDLINNKPIFDPNPYWTNPIPNESIDWDLIESNKAIHLFDHTGYDLCPIEQEYGKYNPFPGCELTIHRNDRHISLQMPWYSQPHKTTDYVLNHSMILRRYALEGKALEQLKAFAKRNHLLNKVINLNPKWGFDFSLDYVNETEAFEILHYEYDGFDYENIINAQSKIQNLVDNTDFEKTAQDLLQKKSEWFNLDFFEQSHWKCNYFGIPDERFKLVIWNSNTSSA